ncbi:3-oxoacyl-ACP reductase [Enterococcus faecalis]
MNFTEYQGKHIWITGAASGIGQAQAQAFTEQGANVFALDIDPVGLAATAQRVKHHPGQFDYFPGDVSQLQQVQQAVYLANQRFGTIDVLVNTAGILDAYKPTLETSEKLWERVMNTNVKGSFHTTNTVLPQFIQQKQGVIINMASIAGLVAGGGGAAYTTAKHAIIGYTKQVDLDYAKYGIRANAIAPGAIKTPMNAADFAGTAELAAWVAKETPAGRWAQPSEVAALTLFLASNCADYIHGSVFPIDGGWLEK